MDVNGNGDFNGPWFFLEWPDTANDRVRICYCPWDFDCQENFSWKDSRQCHSWAMGATGVETVFGDSCFFLLVQEQCRTVPGVSIGQQTQ